VIDFRFYLFDTDCSGHIVRPPACASRASQAALIVTPFSTMNILSHPRHIHWLLYAPQQID
jgi:hypothetical protein